MRRDASLQEAWMPPQRNAWKAVVETLQRWVAVMALVLRLDPSPLDRRLDQSQQLPEFIFHRGLDVGGIG